MKILYDHQMFSTQRFGGITKYFCELMKNFPVEHQFNLSLLLSYNAYLREDQRIFKKLFFPLPEKQFKGRRLIKNKIYFFNQQYSKHSIASNKYDLLHPTFYDNYFFNSLRKPYVITVHDLIRFKFKDKFYWKDAERDQMGKVIKNAQRIISVSHNTKNDLIDIFNVDANKVDVIYHGFNTAKRPKLNKFGQYILFVGQREGYKNFKNFINAISSLLNSESDLKLLCVGKPFNKEELLEISKLKILKQTIALSVNEEDLQNLYAHALVFVYPSLYEGFGMPILEAFANNCPVCLSNSSSFPEVAENAAIYFDPNNIESILYAIKKILYDDSTKKHLIFEGQKRLRNFSWQKTASETIKSYQKIV